MSATIAKLLAPPHPIERLEMEILLAHVLNVSRTYLHTWSEKTLSFAEEKKFLEWVARRKIGEPVAYLTGHREFWSLDLIVTPDVLIPRHETELLVESVLENVTVSEAVICDLGTGSGCVALAIASEKPNWTIHATDISSAALQVAKLNAQRLNISNIVFHHGTWDAALPSKKFDAIVSNPPYIAEDDPHLTLGDLRFEPQLALIAKENGLSDIKQIIAAAKSYLKAKGILFLEHGFQQAENILNIFKKEGYTFTNTYRDLSDLNRVTIASMRF